MSEDKLKAEADLRIAAVDRLIAASSSYAKLVFEETLERWRHMTIKAPDDLARKFKID